MLQKYSPYILCFLIALFVAALYVNNFSLIEKFEWKLQDILFSVKSDDDSPTDIIMVDIDNRSLKEYGDWPWPNERLADLVAAVGQGEPRTILLDMFINPDVSLDKTGGIDTLAGQMSWMNNVVVPFDYAPDEYMSNKISNPKFLFPFSIAVDDDLGLLDNSETQLARNVFLPPAVVCQFAAGLGFKSNLYDYDRKIRWEPTALYFNGYYYPSASIMAAAHYLKIPTERVTVYSREYVQIGTRQVPINDRGNYLINFQKPNNLFKKTSAADILSEAYPIQKLSDKLVIISLTADNYNEIVNTPIWDKMPSSRKTANVIENILHSNFIKEADANGWTGILVILLFGLAFAFVLPRITGLQRGIVLGSTMVVGLMATYYLFDSMNILFKPFYLALELTLLFFAGPFLDNDYLSKLLSSKFKFLSKYDAQPVKSKPKKAHANTEERPLNEPIDMSRQPSQSYSDDPSAEPDDDSSATTAIPSDGVDLKNSSDDQSATMVQEDIQMEYLPQSLQSDEINIESKPDDVEIISNTDENEPASEINSDKGKDEIILNESGGIAGGMPELKNLGRYKVMGILGKGAMGTVYKGVDPAIDRNVALKTIRLDFVNDPAELEELKVRLSREAKAAGMLSHPNIVTIYDVGAEGNLQYIAMEYLEGQTLEEMIRRKVKFNYKIIAQIMTQICIALDFAHNQGIVHRDIKPANIMVMDNYNIKVMDFGIARVDSSSMTRTGIAMGTPNYISPEQLQGKQVDRRCDIFSLGVVMYEMLLHRRPFKGENLTSLIYSIVNSEPEPPSKVDSSVPTLFDRVISKALQKDPTERYQYASEISGALSDFVQSFMYK